MSQLENQTIVITGAASGIGRAIAEGFLDSHAHVVAAGVTVMLDHPRALTRLAAGIRWDSRSAEVAFEVHARS
ncbi:MAG: SDR family NAD(P)-dependent oxidoreductase [Myxococcota bacterium]